MKDIKVWKQLKSGGRKPGALGVCSALEGEWLQYPFRHKVEQQGLDQLHDGGRGVRHGEGHAREKVRQGQDQVRSLPGRRWMTPRAVANQAVDKQIAKHYEELQQHGAAEPRLAPAWPEPAVAPPEPAANDQPGRSPIPSEGGEGLPSSAPDDGGWGELGRAADEGARADALMRRRKLQQWQAEVTKLGGTAKIEEQEFEDGKGSKKPAVHFELPTLAEIGICATIGCQRVKQYPEGFDWDCCCKGCFATDGQHHEVGAATDELKSLPLYGEELEDGGQYTVVLCRIWIDSANYSGGSKSAPDSVIVFLWNFVTQNAEFKSRRIITVIRKKDCCSSCGCSGRCSTDRIKEVINWDFENLRLGRRQTVNSRGQALSADRVAAATAKPQRLVKGLLREAGLDIMELGHSFNLRAMSSKERPCVKCFASGENMYDFTIDHRRASSDTYMAEVDAQTVKRCVSRPEAAQIQTALVCDLRKDGLRGRALAWDCAGFKWGDRLEASGSIIDSRMDLRLLHPFPAEMTRHVLNDQIYDFGSCPCVVEMTTSEACLVKYHKRNQELFVLPGEQGTILTGLRIEAVHFNWRYVQNYRRLHSEDLRQHIVARGGVLEVMCGGRRQMQDFSTCGAVSFNPWTEFVKVGRYYMCPLCAELWR